MADAIGTESEPLFKRLSLIGVGLLVALGMRQAFEPESADFSGISDSELFVSDAFHQATIGIATGKQLDDINNQISALRRQMEVTRRQIAVQQNTVYTQNRGILSEKKPLAKKVEQLNEQLSDADIINPVSGTVLIKYAQAGEMVAAGKPLYKIANLAELNLRAYLTGDQFSKLKLGDTVKVKVDYGKEDYKEYDGIVTWISGKAEFTPKTIQTKEERANLVYASKIKVKNDGFLKIGMYGEVEFLNKER